MCLHPEVQKKAHEELDGVLQGKRLPELEDQIYMPYITAIAKEATRWHPVLPTGSSFLIRANGASKLTGMKESRTCPQKMMNIMVTSFQKEQSL